MAWSTNTFAECDWAGCNRGEGGTPSTTKVASVGDKPRTWWAVELPNEAEKLILCSSDCAWNYLGEQSR